MKVWVHMKTKNKFLSLIISMLGAFIFYKIYTFAIDWNFAIAFLGGAITISTVVIFVIIPERFKEKNTQ